MDVVDFSLYPDREYQLAWIRTFLKLGFAESGRLASDVTDVDVERLYVQVNKFSLVSFFPVSFLQHSYNDAGSMICPTYSVYFKAQCCIS